MFRYLILLAFLLFSGVTLAGEKSLYDFIWLDPDKKVYVLQNKLFKKEHSIYMDVGYISNLTSKFQDTRGFTVKAGWYFHEEWGIEAFMNKYSNFTNDDYKSVRIINSQVPFIRRFNNTYGLVAIWSPFYGKINTFNNIYYFDWSFGLGGASIDAESNLKTAILNASSVSYDKESYSGLIVKSDLKFHIQENLHLGLGYMNTYYRAPSPKNPKSDQLRTNTDIILSIGFSI